eukprot:s154_g9.t1
MLQTALERKWEIPASFSAPLATTSLEVDPWRTQDLGVLQCLSTGLFNESQATCVPGTCGTLSDVPPFAPHFIGDSCSVMRTGQVCTAFCEPGYDIVGNASVLLCDGAPADSAGFTEVVPGCRGASAAGLAELQYTHSCGDQQHDEVCTGQPCNNSLPQGAGVSHNCDGTTAYGTCDATCGQAGYTYTAGSQKEIFTCMPWGSFQGWALGSFYSRSQKDLVLDGIYSHNCKSKRFGDTCGVSCATGYHLSGWGSQYVCGADGTFEGVLPQCNGNPCQNTVDDPALDASACNSLTTGEDCNVTCQAGYGFNQTTVVCGASGFLSGILPICSPLPCAADPELQHPTLAHSCSSVPFGQSCVVFCANLGGHLGLLFCFFMALQIRRV